MFLTVERKIIERTTLFPLNCDRFLAKAGMGSKLTMSLGIYLHSNSHYINSHALSEITAVNLQDLEI